jgi:hypothetical protein
MPSRFGSAEQTYTPQRAYPAAIKQQAGDYDELMGRYRGALNTPAPSYTPYATPEQTFNPTTGYGDLQELAETGGLGEAGISSLRERGISPIRSVYANAMRQMQRQQALQGGYSPNAPAAQARMARELSEQIGGTTTNVNAQIAQMVQQGRLQAAPALANLQQSEAARRDSINQINIANQQRAAEFNRQMMAQMQQSQTGREAELLGGMRQMYGTTPGLVQTFGNQALQAEQMARTPIPVRGTLSSPRSSGISFSSPSRTSVNTQPSKLPVNTQPFAATSSTYAPNPAYAAMAKKY